MHELVERARLIIEIQLDGAAREVVKNAISQQGATIHALERENARLRAGLPDGVTADEWVVIKELRDTFADRPPTREPQR